MAVAVCGCSCVKDPAGYWCIERAEAECPYGHREGQRGVEEGDPERVSEVGDCVTVVFERQSRTAMLLTMAEGGSGVVAPSTNGGHQSS